MSASRDEIIRYANELVRLHDYPDYGPMGAQILGDETVEDIFCAVSANFESFSHGKRNSLFVVHHGLFWNNEPRILDKRTTNRLACLTPAGATVLAYHLALDAHPEFGNNVMWAKKLGVKNLRPFGGIGWGGTRDQPIPIDSLLKRLDLPDRAIVFPYGPNKVKRIASITGGAAHYIFQAVEEGYHLFVTGEADEQTQALAKELGIHFIAAGHHYTEKIGVQELAKRVAEHFDLKWHFIDVPNPV